MGNARASPRGLRKPAAVDWTQGAAALPAGNVTLEFRFDADPSCSDQTQAQPNDPVGVCCAGWDSGGHHLDDIRVAAKP